MLIASVAQNGPIIQGADGKYHLFDPVYQHKSLWHVIYYAHGTASKIEGPYDWNNPNISSTVINPGALVLPDAKTPGKMVYTYGSAVISGSRTT